ncbi:hypothetical protein BKA69DRAFT_902123 [Paraphysoderma sedebokerense]|nr:hypothetical protein BKA69DRAFT_902123 [Paraphysoderma sedebokerense]
MSVTTARIHSFLINYTVIAACTPLIFIFIVVFCYKTPKSKRWNTPFILGLCLLVLTFVHFIVLATYQIISLLATFEVTQLGQRSLLLNTLTPIHTTTAEICLLYMVYRIYPRNTFRRILLPIIVVSLFCRLGTQIWATFNYMTGKDTVLPGTLNGIALMWTCTFFSSLFIYRYRRKLKASMHAGRQFRTLLTFSIQNAIIPTLILFPLFIFAFIPKTPEMIPAILVLNLLFRFSLGVLVAYPLFLLNYQFTSVRMQNVDLAARFKTIHNTTVQFLTSFGLERKVDNILDTFLRHIHAIFGGDVGYFVEQNRYDQTSVVCGFSFKQNDSGEIETTIFSAGDRSDIPMPLLQHGVLLNETLIRDYDGPYNDQSDEEVDLYLQDRSDSLSAVLLLPVKFPGVTKRKLIYLERHHGVDIDANLIDVQTLELLAGHLAAALDGAR